MSSASTTTTAHTTTIKSSPTRSLSSHLPPFYRRAQKHHAEPQGVSLRRSCTRELTHNSSSSIESTASSSSCSLSASSSPPPEKGQKRRYPAACADMIISGVSAILIMPMPFLDLTKRRRADSPTDQTASEPQSPDSPTKPRTLKGMFQLSTSPKPQRRHIKRNSLVLPEVPMPDESDEPEAPFARKPQCTVRDSPPPMENRTVRFTIPPEKFGPPAGSRGDDDEPAWSDFM